ncbi:hypothetical protein IF1G_04798 [Cordyceps javanica]|uniref:Uncharacterized protein n=1 Tax=Cordyceps javanica TaxID=43265 RepID=A0A545V3D3_9HYPO|nr:hypothetical protein IF1G_04798 [Cordyceps javanica]
MTNEKHQTTFSLNIQSLYPSLRDCMAPTYTADDVLSSDNQGFAISASVREWCFFRCLFDLSHGGVYSEP